MKKILIGLILMAFVAGAAASESKFSKFVYREGDKLMDENGELRFISFNVPCLHYNEDNMPFAEINPWRLPDEFEINDALESVRQMGGNVVRIYTLSIKKAGEDPNIPRHVTGPGKFNDEAYKSLDMTMAIANRKGIRIIFPFIDNARWWGGVETCAAFRGKERADFWTDPQLFEDYKAIVASVINRTNSVTGVKYRDDKTILAWETGNELNSPPEWTAKAAEYIKSIDKNHLVIDGYHLSPVRETSIQDKNIDIVTTHYYPVMFWVTITPADMIEQIKRNTELARGKKAYFVGEFGFIPTKDIDSLLQTVMDEKISGALIWSLRFHDRDGGFYWHSEPHGKDLYKAYHWPGFVSGEAYDETGLLTLMRRKAFEMRGIPSPAIEKPAAPVLLDFNDVAAISWRGSAGASGYNVERAENRDGPWVIAGRDISDADFRYRPLFNDTGADIGKTYYYRVTAKNSASESGPSNIVGPISVSCKTLVDEMQDFKFISNKSGSLSIEANEARKFKEDATRLRGIRGSYVVYKVEPAINSWRVYSFFSENISDFKFDVSADGKDFKPVKFERRAYFTGRENYGYHIPVLYTGTGLGDGAQYLKITYTGEAQISRVEIKYGK
ncbi:MAG: hypothetical protein ABSG82_07935 [Sedimentisphaerales bacterium]|jgi:hypothetical protein